MSWKRAVGTVAAQTGACGALLSSPTTSGTTASRRASPPSTPPALDLLRATTRGSRGHRGARRLVRPLRRARERQPRDGRRRVRRVVNTAADEPAAAGGPARLTAALQERDLGSLAGARHLPPETVAHLWHEALAPFLEDEGCDATACGPFAPAVAQIQRRPAARAALRRAAADLGGGEGFEGLALALVAASAQIKFRGAY